MLSHRDRANSTIDWLVCCLHFMSTRVHILVRNQNSFRFVLPCCDIHPPSAASRRACLSIPTSQVAFNTSHFTPSSSSRCKPTSTSVVPNAGVGRTKQKLQPGATQTFPSHISLWLLLANAGWIPAPQPTGAGRDLASAPYQIFSRREPQSSALLCNANETGSICDVRPVWLFSPPFYKLMGSQIPFDGSRVPKPKADWILWDQLQATLILIQI